MVKFRLGLRARRRWAAIGCVGVLGLAVLFFLNLRATADSVSELKSIPAAGIESVRAAERSDHTDLARPGNASKGTHSELQDAAQPASPPPQTNFLPMLSLNHWTPGELPYGVQIHWVNAEQTDKTEQMGARWVRTSLSWRAVEPVNVTPENYLWPATLDAQFALLSAAGTEAIVTIQGNPSWAATYAGGPLDLLDYDVSEMVEFVQAAVERYSAPPYNVKYWEFYNEQDNGDLFYAELGWGYFGNTPELYVDLLVALYPAIKAADPDSQVVFGGMSYDNWTWQGGPMVQEFLDGVLDYGERQYPGVEYFDYMNFHFYSLWRHIWEPPSIIGKAANIRAKLASYGVVKPIICTEAGMWSWPTYDPDGDPTGAEQQSRYVPQLYARSMAAELIPTIWYELVDTVHVGQYKHGLLTSDLQPKPAYHAYQTLARQLGSTNYVRVLDHIDTGSDQIEAYEFITSSGSETILVAWTNDDTEYTLVLEAAQVDRVEKWGDRTTVYDGDDGTVDGVVSVVLEPSPVYVRYATEPGQ